MEKLDHPDLPHASAFYSGLKEGNVLQSEVNEWVKKGCKGRRPKTLAENYTDLQWAWMEEEVTSFKHFVRFYNNLNVSSFVTAVEQFEQFYRARNLDVFKIAISVPGIARKILFDVAKNEECLLFPVRQGGPGHVKKTSDRI